VTLFEFVVVLESIIVGLGIAEILTDVGQAFRRRGTVRIGMAHRAMVLLVLLFLVQHWWDSWSLRTVAVWSFPGLLMFLAGPILLFLLAHVVLPRIADDVDLEEYYDGQAGLLWGLAAIYLATTILFRPLLRLAPLVSGPTALRAGGIVLCVVLASTRRKWVHLLGVGIALAMLLVYVFLFAHTQTD